MAPNHFFQSLDLFSKPFSFSVGNTKQKRTSIGGVMSFSILAVGIIYFYYLINMYFTNKVEPKIYVSNSVEKNFQSISIKENFLIFEIMVQGEPLKEYERRVGKTYLEYKIYYLKSNSDESQDYQIFAPVKCTDPNFTNFMCMNESDVVDKDIWMSSAQNQMAVYGISILPCDSSKYNNCATNEEISNILFNGGNQLTIMIQIQQYNPLTLQYERAYKTEHFQFDPAFYFFSKISLSKATTTITSGMIIQTSESKDTIYDYKRMDSIKSMEYAKKQEYDDLVWIIFDLDQVYTQISVQYPMVTEVLAQFMSIFNSLMILGIICRKFAENQINDDMSSMLLQEYYKKSCVSLLTKKEGRKQSKFQMGVTSKEIIDLSKKIKTINIQQIKQQIFKISLGSKLKTFIMKFFKMNQIQQDDKEKESKQYELMDKKLLDETTKRINIFELYKDIIQIKMAIKLILTKEQYAALKFCGSELPTDHNQFRDDNATNQRINQRESIQNNVQQKIKLISSQKCVKQASHLQKPNSPSNSQYLQDQYILSNQDFKIVSPTFTERQLIFSSENQDQDNESQSNPQSQQQQQQQQQQQKEQDKRTKSIFMRPSFISCNKILNTEMLVFPPTNEGDFEVEMKDCEAEMKDSKPLENENTKEFQKNFLSEMDLIDESEESQAYFFERFLQKNLAKNGSENINLLDLKILSNLLINDFEFPSEEEGNQNNACLSTRKIQTDKNFEIETEQKQLEDIE